MNSGLSLFREDYPDITQGLSDREVASGMYGMFLEGGGDAAITPQIFQQKIGYFEPAESIVDTEQLSIAEQSDFAGLPSQEAMLSGDVTADYQPGALGEAGKLNMNQLQQQPLEDFGEAARNTGANVYARWMQAAGGMMRAAGDASGNEVLADAGAEQARSWESRQHPIGTTGSDVADIGMEAGGSIAHMFPGVSASLATGSFAPALAWIGTQVGGEAYQRGREFGMDGDSAASYAALYGAAEALPEALPLGVLLKRMKTAGVGTLLGLGAATEAVQEPLTEALQFAIDKFTLAPEISWSELPDKMKHAAIVGGVSGGLMGGGAAAMGTAQNQQIGRQNEQAELHNALLVDFDEGALNRNVADGVTRQMEGKRMEADTYQEPVSLEASQASVELEQAYAEGRDPEYEAERAAIESEEPGREAEEFIPFSANDDGGTFADVDVDWSGSDMTENRAAEIDKRMESIGWATVGGKVISDWDVPVWERTAVHTKWEPYSDDSWWSERPGDLNAKTFKAAWENAKAGKRLGVAQQRAYDYLLELTDYKARDAEVAQLSFEDATGGPLDLADSTSIAVTMTEAQVDKMIDAVPADELTHDQRVTLQDSLGAQEYLPEAIMGGAKVESQPGNLREMSGGALDTRPGDYQPSTPDGLYSFQVPQSSVGSVDNMAAAASTMPKWRPFFDMNFAGERAAMVEPGDTSTIELSSGTLKLPTLERPARRDSVRTYVEQLIGPRIYTGNIRTKGTEGFHLRAGPGQGTIRLRQLNNPEVMLHEVAHYLHRFNSSTRDVFDRFSYKVPEFAYSDMDGDEAGQRSEGLAEFTRLWMTQYPYMKNLEPELTAAFDDIVSSLPRKPRGLMYAIQTKAHGHYWQGAENRARAALGDPLTQWEHWLEFTQTRPLQKFRSAAIDEFYTVQAVQHAVDAADRDAAHDAYKQAQLAYGASAVMKTVVENGAISMVEPGHYEFTGKGLQEIFKPAAKHGRKRMALLVDYMVALRGQELKGEGRENRLDDDMIAAGLAHGETYPEFKQIAADFKQFNDAMLDWYVDMGSIAPEQRDQYQEFQAYLPFVRWKQANSDGTGAGGGSTLGKRLMGGQGNINDPIKNIMAQLFVNIRNAQLNLSRRTMYEDIQKHPDGARFATPIPEGTERLKVAVNQMASRIAGLLLESGQMVNADGEVVEAPEGGLNRAAIEAETIAALEKRPWMITFFRRVAPKSSDEVDTEIDSYIGTDGETHYMEINDPGLRDMVEMGGQPDFGRVARFAIRTKGVVTRAITVPIQFMAPNIVRDIMSGTAVTRNVKQIPVIDPILGMYDYFSNNERYKEAMLHGAGFSGIIDSSKIAEDQFSALNVKRNKAEYLLPWVMAAKAWQGLEYVAGGFEYGTRGGEYRAARRAGKSRSEAAWEAREISTDFAKHGNGAAWVTFQRTVPFMQASINGIDKTMRMFFQRNGGFKFSNAAQIDRAHARFYIAWAGVGAFAIAQYLRYGDEDWYKQLPIDQKARFMWFGADNKMPLPYDIGSIFATLPIAIMMAFDDKGREGAKLMGFSLMSMFGVGSMPAFMAPIWEVAQNRDWKDSPITPPRFKGIEPSKVKGPRTKILYEGMADAFSFPELALMARNNQWETIESLFSGLNAYQWEHMVSGYFGYMADYAADATEALLWDKDKWGEKPFPVELSDYVDRQFVGSKATFRTKYTTGFYALKRRADDAAKNLRFYGDQIQKRGMTWDEVFPESTAVQAARLIQGDIAAKELGRVNRVIRERRDVIDDIYYNPQLNREQKETQMEEQYSAINAEAKQAYKWIQRDVLRAEEVLTKGYGADAMRAIYRNSERAQSGN